MSKEIKKIPLSVLAKKSDDLWQQRPDRNKAANTFDIVPEWVPHPDNIQISIQWKKVADEDLRSQFHNRFVLKLALKGRSFGFVDNSFFDFLPGEGILVFPFQRHSILKTPDPDGQLRLLINFTMDESDRLKLEHLRNKTFKIDDKLRGMVDELLRQLHELPAGRHNDTYFALLRILHSLPELIFNEKVVSPAKNEKFEKIFSYMCQNCRAYAGLKEIAEKFGYSEAGLNKLFRRECKRSPGSIIRELRLRDAASMLRMTKLSIREISDQCGFSNAYVFSRAFRSYFNTSPREFRISRLPK